MKRKYIHFVVFIHLAFTHFFGETNTYKEEGKWKDFCSHEHQIQSQKSSYEWDDMQFYVILVNEDL